MAAKTNVMLTGILLLSAVAVARAEQAPVRQVVVYADRAQVTRGQTVDCARGQAVFSGLPSTLQVKTLWASLSGGGGEVVGLTHDEEGSGPRPEARALQQQIRQVDKQRRDANQQIDAARATMTKLQSFRQHMQQVWGLEAASRNPRTAGWDAALDLLRQQALAARVRQRQASTQLRELGRKRDRLYSELQAIEQKRRRTTITATAHLKCTGRRTVELSYVVPHATWEMGYQLRADPTAGKVTLVVQAAIHQGTGEDWDNVTLAVSTANLQRRNIPPKLREMKVSTYEPSETRKILSRRFEHRKHLTTASRSQLEQASLKEKARAPSGGEVAAPPAGVAFKLTAARRASVKGDGRRTVVELQRRPVKGTFVLETVPKLFPFVYHKVEVINPFDFTLLPGKVSLFQGRTFVGQTAMKLRAPREPFAFSLGVEKQLQVHRYVKKEKVEGQRGWGHEKKLRHRYTIQVGNWTNKTQRVRVLENVPVSQVREIDVSLSDDSTKPTRWNKTDGILTWQLKLSPRSKKELVLDYTVHLPKTYKVQGY